MIISSFAFTLLVTAYAAFATKATHPTNPCYCAAMNSSNPEDKLVEQQLQLTLPCDDKGEQDCKRLCIALANTTKADPEGKDKFCELYAQNDRIYVNVFSKVCGRPYVFTGIAGEKPVCCQNKKSVACV